MWQKNYHYQSLAEALAGLGEIKECLQTHPQEQILLNIYSSGLKQSEIQQFLDGLEAEMPGLLRVGISEYAASWEHTVSLKINVLCAEKSRFKVLSLPCQPGREAKVAQSVRKLLDTTEYMRAMALYPVNCAMNVTEFLQIATQDHGDLPVFGSMARSLLVNTAQDESDPMSFAIAQELVVSGFVVVLFIGAELRVHLNYILGWRPIGRELQFTLGPRSPYGETSVRLIDGRPAEEIFQKYLGVSWDENFVRNVWAFPLMVHRGKRDICFLPIKSSAGTLHFSGRIYAGETLRFSYCTREEILEASFAGSQRLQAFQPEAVMLSLCLNRVGFLGDEAHLEWDFFRTHYPELVFFHGNYEIAWRYGEGGVLNSAFVVVGFRESAKRLGVEIDRSVPASLGRTHGVQPLRNLVSHFFHEMTNELVHFQHNLETAVAAKARANERLSLHVVETLAEAIDAKDTYTKGHSGRVAKYAKEIAKRAGYSRKQQESIYMMGLLHDVGKIGVPDTLINKPGKLTSEEYSIIKNHPVLGAKILKNIQEMPLLVTGARWHHERYDGKGYPDNLQGEGIPEQARIIAVADAYDAMTSNRSYRKALPQSTVRAEIVKGLGTQFDPRFGSIMLQMIDEDVDYHMREL
ncbi:MAG: HD domain-containing protein [Desulfovibrionaceae bacterium]|nr:HD domain-containing protein [Desulfovibrionaceae bacterium]